MILPVVTKAEIKKDPELLISISQELKDDLRIANPSGSSKTPLCMNGTTAQKEQPLPNVFFIKTYINALSVMIFITILNILNLAD
ncbi:MAG: hypothetical protein Q7T48_15500 [Cellvibrio sp.]|uniref:hypothetical protein n=1 Tax=Cellvibrio sp. TaxID=1965322 RepID=UPI002725733A|nr:hypothetical protein [Cellvibrio sp.]